MHHIGIVGINGLVGKAIIHSLELLNYNDSGKNLFYFYGTSEGITNFNNQKKPVHKFLMNYLNHLDYCILATDNKNAREIYNYINENKLNVIVIDNSSEFRLEKNIPLCIPEINENTLTNLVHPKIISNPNCVTTLLCMCLKPLLKLGNIKKIIVSTKNDLRINFTKFIIWD